MALLIVIEVPHCFPQVFKDIEWYDVDSLLTVLPAQAGKERIKTINRLATSLSFENFNRSYQYAQEALLMSEKLNYVEGIAAAKRNYARIHFFDGDYPKALNFFREAADIYKQLGYEKLVGEILEEHAATYFYAKNLMAFEILVEAMNIFRKKDKNGTTVGNVQDTMGVYSRLGLAYRTIGRSDTALLLYLKYLEIGAKNNFEITDMLVHTGLVAACYMEVGKYDSSIYYYKKAFDFPEVNLSIRAMNHEHRRRIGGIYLAMGEIDTAIRYLSTSYNWLSGQGFLMQSQIAARQLGEIYLKLNDISKAEIYYRRSETLLVEMMQNNSFYRYDSLKYVVSWGRELYLPFTKKIVKEFIYDLSVTLYDQLSHFHLAKNQLRPAIYYLNACSSAKDTLSELVRNREFIELQTRYETEQKETAIINLSKENELKALKLKQSWWFIGGMGGLIIMIGLLAVILIRQNKLRYSQQTLQLQQRLLRTQMNPHFLFNSLSSIQNFIIREKPGEAGDYLSRFSKLVRQILNSSFEEYVPLEDEISSIENYLELQKLRYRNMFDYTIEVDERLDPESVQIPPMLAQPFIENAIEHGIKHKASKGKIDIRFKLQNGTLELEVEDDGVGRQRAQEILREQDQGHKSMATAITVERIRILNKKLRRKILMEIIDLKNTRDEAMGTKVGFEIPLNT